MKSSSIAFQIRWMIRRDMPEVLAIERDSFEFSWSDEDFLACLRQRNCIGMVAEHENRVVGFMVYELHRTKLHILNFAVATAFRRLGAGTRMVEKLINKLSQQRRQEIMLEVRESNLAAQKFFAAQGFMAVGILRGFYADSEEDAYVMDYSICREEPVTMMPKNRISNY